MIRITTAKDAYNYLRRGKVIIISDTNKFFDTSAFFYVDYSKNQIATSTRALGLFVRVMDADKITSHFANMLAEGLTITAKDFWE